MNRRELLQAGARPAGDSRRRPMVPDDINRLRTPAALSLSPDAQVVVFVRRSMAANLERFESSLWACDISRDRLRRLTSGPEDTHPACSPDGRTVAFLRKVSGKPQVFLTNLEGGEARLFVSLSDGVSSIAWSPDGLTLAVSGPTDKPCEISP
jgi:dipeptidyl aminopeptidase/acylaminoacyl peptidase